MFSPTVDRFALGELRFPMTYEDYLTTFEDTVQVEWVEGEVIVFIPQTNREADVRGFISTILAFFLDATGLGRGLHAPFEMRLWPGRSSRMPDIHVLLTEHLHRRTNERLEGPADVVFEIVSDDSVERDYVEKRREYAEAGILEYWIIDGRRGFGAVSALVLSPDGAYEAIPVGADGRMLSGVLSGFWLELSWFTSDNLPSEVAVLRTMCPSIFSN